MAREKCNGLLAFEQLAGMLVRSSGGYAYRCMTCGRTGVSKSQPEQGMRCQRPRDRDVHTEHCCKKHGCKYNDRTCPVETGAKLQSYPCEDCENQEREDRHKLEELKKLVKGAEKRIDGLLPAGIKRMGPLNLQLAFEPEAGWSASFDYKITRRLNGSTFRTTNIALSEEDAVEALLALVALTAKNTGKKLSEFW